MKQTINGKRYNTETCEVLAERDHYNHSNNYSGTTRLILARNGQLLLWTDANGQDLYLRDRLRTWEAAQENEEWTIDDLTPTSDEAETKMVELGLIEVV